MAHYPAVTGRVSTTHITSNSIPTTTVDCEKQVRSWRFLRSVSELLIPTCNCTTFYNDQHDDVVDNESDYYIPSPPKSSPKSTHRRQNSNPFATAVTTTTVMGTIYGYRNGKVKFCIQTVQNPTVDHSNKLDAGACAIPPILLLLELAIPTSLLAREMRGGVLRIALECNSSDASSRHSGESAVMNNRNNTSLLSVPVWTMYCNGRRVGFAGRRHPGKADMEFLRKMGTSVTAGAGVIAGKELGHGSDNDMMMTKDVMYLRGKFERVRGSRDAESFHLINDDSADSDGCINQDLSVFFLRSR